MKNARLLLAVLCLGLVQCDTPTVGEGGAGASAEVAEPAADPRTGPKARIVQLARVEGYGNPQTGELWVRATPTLEGLSLQENGVQASGQFLPAGGDLGYCDITVENDGVRDSNPPGTWEFYTSDIDGMQTATPNDNSSFNAAECLSRVSPAAQGANDHGPIFSALGSGCALQHVGNFTGLNFSNVYLDVDVFNGDAGCSGPYGPPWGDNQDGTGGQPTPATIARNEPQGLKGLWNYGPVNNGELKDLWIFFQNCPGAVAFDWTGFLLAEVVEECANGTDDDCDGVVNNGCALIGDGASCYTDADCTSGYCQGAILSSGIGMGGDDLADDIAGVCYPAHCGNLTPDPGLGETGLDCGGPCGPCGHGSPCLVNGDCPDLCNSAGFCYDSALCGDSNMDPGETCDDGPLETHDNAPCKADCSMAFCGDGLIDCTTEQCDGGGGCAACSRTAPVSFQYTGAVSGMAGNCLNWTPTGVPLGADTAIFDSGSPSATLGADRTVDTLHLQSGFGNTVMLVGDLTANTAVILDGGTLLQTGGDITTGTITVASSGTWGGGADTATVSGDLFVAAGASVTSPATLVVGGDFTADSAAFVSGGGLVDLTNQAPPQVISGAGLSFDDLSLTHPAGVYQFEAGSTFTVTGTFTAVGAPTQQLSLGSTEPGIQWTINPAGLVNVDEVSVQDSFNLGAPIGPPSWADLGNNDNWAAVHGFFVVTDDVVPGTFGGMAGAHAECLSQLTTGSWQGKTAANNRGLLTAGQIEAFLCDSSGCINGWPDREYRFASVPNPTNGGAPFTTDGSGLGPNDNFAWGQPTHFGDLGISPANGFWSGRATGGSSSVWPDTVGTAHCMDWTSGGPDSGRQGVISGVTTDANRWDGTGAGCGSSVASLVCFVHPEPSCSDGIKNGDESDIDCGGSCTQCLKGSTCNGDSDCLSSCNTAGLCYIPADCGDGVPDPGEECDTGGSNDNNGACKLDCANAFCGDGFVQCGVEGCDGGGNCDGDCLRIGPENFSFTGAASLDITNCVNWLPNGVPALFDTAIFDAASPVGPTSVPGGMIDSLRLESGFGGTVNIDGPVVIASEVYVDSGTLALGSVGSWTVGGLDMAGTGVVSAGANTLRVNGPAIFTTNFSAGTGTVVLAPQDGDSISFGDATFNGLSLLGQQANANVTIAGNPTVNGPFSFGDNTAFNNATYTGPSVFTVNGVTTGAVLAGDTMGFPTATFTFNGDVTLTSGGAMTFAGVNFDGGPMNVHADSNNTWGSGIAINGTVGLSGDSNLGFQNISGIVNQNGFDLTGTAVNVFGQLQSNGGDVIVDSLTVSSAAVWDGSTGTAAVAGNFTASPASVVTAPASLAVGSNFTVQGAFTGGTGTVDLTAASATTVDANNVAFNNLTLSNPTGLYSFAAGTAWDVFGFFSAVGNPGNTLVLQSTESPTPWAFELWSGYNIDYVAVQDSTHQGGVLTVPNWTDNTGNTNWPPPPTHGYFVVTDTVPGGISGGLVGANSFCLNELTMKPWLGKDEAENRGGFPGIVTMANVKAWLCINSGCVDLTGSTDYHFASVPNQFDGGAVFTSTAAGMGPGDSVGWGDGAHFGTLGANNQTWTGRSTGSSNQWGSGPTVSLCSDWTGSGTGSGGRISTGDTGTLRWNAQSNSCTSSNQHLICMVNP